MSATQSALHIYEIVENIVHHLDRPSIHRCEVLNACFRTVALESPLIAKQMLATLPIKASAIKPLTKTEEARLAALTFNSFPGHRSHLFHTLSRSMTMSIGSTRLGYQITRACLFDDMPHYARPTKFAINPRFKPNYTRPKTVSDVRGTGVDFTMPALRYTRELVHPGHYVTDPPITTVLVTLMVYGSDFLPKDMSDCMLRVPTGIRVRDLVRIQKAMMRTDARYGFGDAAFAMEPRCTVYFVYDTLTACLRDIGTVVV